MDNMALFFSAGRPGLQMEALQHEEEKPLSATVPRRTARFRGWLDLPWLAWLTCNVLRGDTLTVIPSSARHPTSAEPHPERRRAQSLGV